MKSFCKLLGLSICISIANSGCEKPTPPAPAPSTASPENRRTTPANLEPSTTPSAVAPAPAVTKPTRDPQPANQVAGDIPVQYLAPALQTALTKYSTLGDKDARSDLASDVATMANDGVPKPQVAAALGKMLREETSVEVAADILVELADLDDPAALGQILPSLDLRQPEEIRLAAIEALDDLDDVRAIPALKQLLKDRSQEVREAAQDAIDSISP